MRYIVAFDISDDRVRRKVADILEAYGLRVQRSLFEVEFKDINELLATKMKIQSLINKKQDSVRFYYQDIAAIKNFHYLGFGGWAFKRDLILFF